MYFFVREQISRADRRENLRDGRALSRTWFLHFWWRYLYGSPNRRGQNVFFWNVTHYRTYTAIPELAVLK